MSGTGKYLIDTNILIYFIDGKLSKLQKERVISVFEQSFNISVISKIEFFGFKDYLDKDKFKKANEFIANAQVFQLSDDMTLFCLQETQRILKNLTDYKFITLLMNKNKSCPTS